MNTDKLSLVITFNSDCTSVKFRGECDGDPTEEHSVYGAAIYAAVQDIVNDEEQFELKLVH